MHRLNQDGYSNNSNANCDNWYSSQTSRNISSIIFIIVQIKYGVNAFIFLRLNKQIKELAQSSKCLINYFFPASFQPNKYDFSL